MPYIEPLLSRFYGSRFGLVQGVRTRISENGLETIVSAYGTSSMKRGEAKDRNENWCAGHGFHVERAVNGAIGEGLERYGSQFTPFNAEIKVGSHKELKEELKLSPIEDYALYTKDQLPHIAKTKSFLKDFRNLGADDQIKWIAGEIYDQDNGKQKVYYPYPLISLAFHETHPYCLNTTSGIALGSSFKMAYENALLEFIERDGFLNHWWKNLSPQVYTAQDLIDLKIPGLSDVARTVGDRIYILDFTALWGVPSFCVTIWGRTGQNEAALTVCGSSHLNPLEALTSAVTEVVRIFAKTSRLIRNKEKNKDKEAKKPQITEFDEIITFHDIIEFFSEPTHAEFAKPLLRGERPGVEGLKRLIDIYGNDQRTLEERVCSKGGQVMSFELTPMDLAQGGLYVVRALIPQGIPLNSAHLLRPLAHPSLRNYDPSVLNPFPHPFA